MLQELLKFDPIPKERIWGGNKLSKLLEKKFDEGTIGESWELSSIKNDTSTVNEGSYQGKSLTELLEKFGAQLIGSKNYEKFGTKFPLLIKFIDAKENLSVQLHPNDEIAEKKHNSFGKTEMWHVVQADPDASIIVGFNKEVTPEEYKEHVKNKTLASVLKNQKVKKGDTFFIYSGLIHAIGKGVVIAEIQQTSDITYRIYDWDRTDKNGKSRQLHQEQALEAIDYNYKTDHKISYDSIANEKTGLVDCAFFKTSLLKITQHYILKPKENDSFSILICVHGEGSIILANQTISITFGETILVPACIEEIKIKSRNMEILEVHV